MKLSNETLSVLKNFGNINQGIFFKKGSVLRTVTVHKNILAEAEITEDFPIDFGIYDLNNLLSVITLHKDDPVFEFDDKHVFIIGNNNRSKIKYRFCDPSMIVVPPDKTLVVPNPEVTFTLTNEDFNWVLRAASVLSSPQIAIESDGKKIYLITMNVKDDSAHTDSLEICEGNGDEYRLIFNTENLTKIMPGSYTVVVSSEGISHFKNNNMKLQYWVAIESGSTYKKAY